MNSTPVTLLWAVRLLYAEAAGVALVAGLLLYDSFTVAAANRGSAVALTVFTALVGAALAYLAASLARRRVWARAPAIAVQLFLLPIAFYLTRGGLIWLGIPVGVAALLVIWLLVAPGTREGLNIR